MATRPDQYRLIRSRAGGVVWAVVAVAGIIGLIVVLANFSAWVQESHASQASSFRLEGYDQIGPYAGLGFSILAIIVGAIAFLRPGVDYQLADGTPLRVRAVGRQSLTAAGAERAARDIASRDLARMRRYVSVQATGPQAVGFFSQQSRRWGFVLITYRDEQQRVTALPPIVFEDDDFAVFQAAVR